MLKKQYFKRKVVLDVGCNSGFLTIALGEKFRPRMILGVDIDGVLITKARNLVSMRANEIRKDWVFDSDFRAFTVSKG